MSQQQQHPLPQVSTCVGHIGDPDMKLQCFVTLAFHRKRLRSWQQQQFTQEPVSPLPRGMETPGGEVAPPLQGEEHVGLLLAQHPGSHVKASTEPLVRPRLCPQRQLIPGNTHLPCVKVTRHLHTETPVRRHCLVNKSEASGKFQEAEPAGQSPGEGLHRVSTGCHRLLQPERRRRSCLMFVHPSAGHYCLAHTEAFLGNGTVGKGAACAREPQDGEFAGARDGREWHLHSSSPLASLPGSQEAFSTLGR